MDKVKVTVTCEDDFGVFFREVTEVPREWVVPEGQQTGGISTVAEALLKVARSV